MFLKGGKPRVARSDDSNRVAHSSAESERWKEKKRKGEEP